MGERMARRAIVLLLGALWGCAGANSPAASGGGESRAPVAGPDAPAAPAKDLAPADLVAAEPPTEAAPRERSAETSPQKAPEAIEPFPGVTIRRAEGESVVELAATVVLNEGWLEQIACTASTRTHESLLVPDAAPSQIHAALLMAGFEPGAPGRWDVREDGTIGGIEPTGAALEILVGHSPGSARTVMEWVRDANTGASPKQAPFIFAGSHMVKRRSGDGEREVYEADESGSIIGLVTFGDEVIGYSRVLADAEEVQPVSLEAWPERVPTPGTRITIFIRAWKAPRAGG